MAVELAANMDDVEIIKDKPEFGPNEEAAIISLALDKPDFFITIADYIRPDFFKLPHHQFVFAIVKDIYDEHGFIPTRGLVRDKALKTLKVDDDYEPILALIDRKSIPKEVDFIRNTLIEWTKDRAYAMIYSEEAIDAYEEKNYDELHNILNKANKIADLGDDGLWFFDSTEQLFEEDNQKKFTTGFPKLDRVLNEGGPSNKEVLCYMASTGVGKSILMPNTGAANIRAGKNVLHITLELSKLKTALRYLGIFTEIPIKNRMKEKDKIKEMLHKIKTTYGGDLIIYEFPPDHININNIFATIDWLSKHKNWKPDVIIIDYLELMLSKNSYNNREDYVRQKRVATEVRGLAQITDCLVVTATQSNRSSSSPKDQDQPLDLNKMAESYGKSMPLDYVVSLMQNKEEYEADIPRLRFYVAKNRNGQKQVLVRARINYGTFKVKEE